MQTLWTTVVRKSESRLVALTGRRGVGKTTLLHQAFRGRDGIRYVHFFVPEGSSARRIAALWSGVLSRALGFSASTLGETPFEVLRTAVELTRDDPAVIVVDECQRLDREEPDFWGRLQHLWDSKRKSTRALLIMCGSDAAALERIFNDGRAPMYGRTDEQMRLLPFELVRSAEELHERPPSGWLKCFKPNPNAVKVKSVKVDAVEVRGRPDARPSGASTQRRLWASLPRCYLSGSPTNGTNTMNTYVTGAAIRALREKRGMTQHELAAKLFVSDKAVSKWETGKGFPSIALVERLAKTLEVSVPELLSGEAVVNVNRASNMLKSELYVCPVCGNVVHATGSAHVSCCGITLPELEAEPVDEAHEVTVEKIEHEWFVTTAHPMTKEHHLSFVAYVTGDRFELVKLFPESTVEVRFFSLGRGVLYWYCNQHGLFSRRL